MTTPRFGDADGEVCPTCRQLVGDPAPAGREHDWRDDWFRTATPAPAPVGHALWSDDDISALYQRAFDKGLAAATPAPAGLDVEPYVYAWFGPEYTDDTKKELSAAELRATVDAAARWAATPAPAGPIVVTHQCGDCGFTGNLAEMEAHQCAARPSGDVDGLLREAADYLRDMSGSRPYALSISKRLDAARPSGEVDACTRTHAPGSTHYHVLRPRAALDGRREEGA